MITWQQGFALVFRSDERGVVLASPSQGFVDLPASTLEEIFPDGIELLLLDRTNTTPEQKLGPGWFWPALKR